MSLNHFYGSAGAMLVVIMIISFVGREVLAIGDGVFGAHAISLAFFDVAGFVSNLDVGLPALAGYGYVAGIIQRNTAKIGKRQFGSDTNV
jgi:hypothetical protein